MADQSNAIDLGELLKKLDHLERLLMRCRSVFPTLGEELIGKHAFMTAPYYLNQGYTAQIKLQKPISAVFIEYHNQMGKWVNENTLIHLHGILAYHGIIQKKEKIDKSLPGWKEIDVLRRMRNAFTKTPLNYRPNDKDNKRLRENVIKHFDLKEKNLPEGEILTPIHTVVKPIFKACREYIIALYRSP